MMIYDLEKGKVVDERPAGVVGQISWRRLAKLFADAGETSSFETITHFEVRDNFLVFRTVTERN